jgi:hypothetical protein
MGEALELGTRFLGVAGEEGDGGCAMCVTGGAEPCSDGVECLVPGNALELAAAARSDPLERIEQTIGVIAPVELGVTARTVRPLTATGSPPSSNSTWIGQLASHS